MTRYWIYDNDDTPQRFPLRQLVSQVRLATGRAQGDLVVTKARGYGAEVCEWDNQLDSREHLSVSFEDLERLSTGVDEWFYELDAEFTTDESRIAFSLHDSTALYVDAPHDLAKQIVAAFRDVRGE